jgi:hypothetical protein
MPPNKKNKQAKSKTRTSKPPKKTLQRKQVSRKAPKKLPKKKLAKKKTAQKKSSLRSNARRRSTPVSAEREVSQDIQNRNLDRTSGLRSSDFQGLSSVEEADSESVDELVEEGNVFEAGAVAGVEEADNADEREVHTHEVPEDDVPEEYLDKD